MREVVFNYTGDIVSVNARYMGRSFNLSDRYKEFKEAFSWTAQGAMRGKEPMIGAVSVMLQFTYEPLKNGKDKRMDIDAPVKPVLDGMNGIVFWDDAQVQVLIVQKRRGRAQGVKVRVCEMPYFERLREALDMLFGRVWGVLVGVIKDAP